MPGADPSSVSCPARVKRVLVGRLLPPAPIWPAVIPEFGFNEGTNRE